MSDRKITAKAIAERYARIAMQICDIEVKPKRACITDEGTCIVFLEAGSQEFAVMVMESAPESEVKPR